MSKSRELAWICAGFFLLIPARAESHHGGHGGHSGGHPGGGRVLGWSGGGASYSVPYYAGYGAVSPAGQFISPVTVLPTLVLPVMATPMPGWNGVGVAGPWPPPGTRARPGMAAANAKRADPARGAQLVTIGDRLFRAGNLHRAAERYEQAARADPQSAAPHVRLAQAAILRGQYAEAANQFRDAVAAEPDWLSRASDIQSIYAEPGDFAKEIARLESHLQANPNNRDAWLVLGAQWFLSGRTQKAADVFVRLADRKGDAALEAFLDAAQPVELDRP
jgi:Tetratricopeptide repeat